MKQAIILGIIGVAIGANLAVKTIARHGSIAGLGYISLTKVLGAVTYAATPFWVDFQKDASNEPALS